MIQIENIGDILGKELIVTQKPKYWDSKLNFNNPMSLEYPRVVVLTSINEVTGSATCGQYGWALHKLLEVSVFNTEKNLKDFQISLKKQQVERQISEKLDEIKEQLLKKFDSLVSSGCLPEEYLKENYLLTMALFNNLCETNPFAPKSKQTKKEFDNINKFI